MGILAERHTAEKPQRTHDLIERRPRYPDRRQVDLEGAYILQLETIGGPTEIPAQLRYRGKAGSLRRRRQIANRHVLNHTAAKQLLQKLPSEGLGFENPQSSRTGGCYCDPSSIAAPAASFNPGSQQIPGQKDRGTDMHLNNMMVSMA
jgi:hypothetical protein